MLNLQDALLRGKIGDLESGDKVLLLDQGGALFRSTNNDEWIKTGFERTAQFVSQIVRIYDHQKNIIYSAAAHHIQFITASDTRENDLPLFDEDEQFCRVCGCSYYHACDGGCYWVEADLCSECVKVE